MGGVLVAGQNGNGKRKGKKPAAELTDEEVMRRVFPKPVRDEAKEEVKKAEKRAPKRHGGKGS